MQLILSSILLSFAIIYLLVYIIRLICIFTIDPKRLEAEDLTFKNNIIKFFKIK